AEFRAAGIGLSRRLGSRPRRGACRHCRDRGDCPDLARAQAFVSFRHGGAEGCRGRSGGAGEDGGPTPGAPGWRRCARWRGAAARRELATGFERKVGSIVEAVSVAAGEMQNLSAAMSASNAETVRQTAAAATASSQASSNVETVASATEELSASINSIAQQV